MPLVIFIDMDYFFAACEELRRPELKDKPFAVGTAPEASKMKGVIQTCNYVARKFGVRSAMATSTAYRNCPDLAYLESDDAYYEETSERILKKIRDHGMPVEVYSIDEFAIDASKFDYDRTFDEAKAIKSEVNKEIGLPCTVGVSSGKVFAKMACDAAKPNGALLLRQDEIPAFLKEKEVRKLPGIGPKTEERLKSLNIATIGQLGAADANRLISEFGSFGGYIHNLALGMDNDKVVDTQEVLSISRERTMDNETNDLAVIDAELDKLSEIVAAEARKKSYLFKTITAKARYSDFSIRIKAKSLQNYSDSPAILKTVSKQLIRELVAEKRMRKVGVRISTLINSKGQQKLV